MGNGAGGEGGGGHVIDRCSNCGSCLDADRRWLLDVVQPLHGCLLLACECAYRGRIMSGGYVHNGQELKHPLSWVSCVCVGGGGGDHRTLAYRPPSPA